jgi:hypothetical protein
MYRTIHISVIRVIFNHTYYEPQSAGCGTSVHHAPGSSWSQATLALEIGKLWAQCSVVGEGVSVLSCMCLFCTIVSIARLQ